MVFHTGFAPIFTPSAIPVQKMHSDFHVHHCLLVNILLNSSGFEVFMRGYFRVPVDSGLMGSFSRLVQNYLKVVRTKTTV